MKPTKVPSDFKPGSRVWELVEERGYDKTWVNSQVKEFVFYWQERAGKAAYKSNWQRAFWNWLKNGWEWKQQKQAKQKSVNSGLQNQTVDLTVKDKLSKEENKKRWRELRQRVGV